MQVSLDDPILGGADFLMNQSAVSFGNSATASPKNSVQLGDIDDLQADLNNAFSSTQPAAMEELDMGSGGGSVHFDQQQDAPYQSYKRPREEETMPSFSEIPGNMDQPQQHHEPQHDERSAADIIKAKLRYLAHFKKMEKRGISLSKRYSFEDDVNEMAAEFDVQSEENSKRQAVQMQTSFLKACITGAEKLNKRWDPLDLDLDGWADTIDEDQDEYEDIFEEIHAEYMGAGMGPFFRLACKLAMSGTMVHMSNKHLGNVMPGMDQIMKDNPGFVNHFQAAAANSLQKNGHTGIGGLMNSVLADKKQHQNFNPSQNQPLHMPPAPPHATMNTTVPAYNPVMATQEALRPTMKGPSEDLKDVLSGIKTKELQINLDADQADAVSVVTDMSTATGEPAKKRGRKAAQKNTMNIDTISSDL